MLAGSPVVAVEAGPVLAAIAAKPVAVGVLVGIVRLLDSLAGRIGHPSPNWMGIAQIQIACHESGFQNCWDHIPDQSFPVPNDETALYSGLPSSRGNDRLDKRPGQFFHNWDASQR